MGESSNEGGRAGPLPLVVGARNGGIAVAAILAAVGALFAWLASLLDLGHVGLPGPGFFPLVLAITVTFFSVIIGIEYWKSAAGSEAAGNEKVEFFHRDVVIVMAALLAVPLVFVSLGALLTLAVFVVAVLVFVARVSLWLAVVAAAAFVAACWIMFEVLLGLQLPTGPF
jgi:hypothetical protein